MIIQKQKDKPPAFSNQSLLGERGGARATVRGGAGWRGNGRNGWCRAGWRRRRVEEGPEGNGEDKGGLAALRPE
jgi:hypothetical protein